MIHAHSFLRWVVLLFALLTIVKSFNGMRSKRAFVPSDRKMPLFFMISMDSQLLIGLFLYFTGALGVKNIENLGMANVMKDTAGRFFAIEHTIGMFLAIIFAHIAFSITKRPMADSLKFKRIFIFSLLSLVAILVSIPWPFRELIGRPLFPGMH